MIIKGVTTPEGKKVDFEGYPYDTDLGRIYIHKWFLASLRHHDPKKLENLLDPYSIQVKELDRFMSLMGKLVKGEKILDLAPGFVLNLGVRESYSSMKLELIGADFANIAPNTKWALLKKDGQTIGIYAYAGSLDEMTDKITKSLEMLL